MEYLYDNINNYTNIDYKKFLKKINKTELTKYNKLVNINDKKLFLLSRHLLASLLSKYNINYQKMAIYYNNNNKPYINNIYYNISHSNDYALVAISTKEIGVDIEKITSKNKNIINTFCNQKEKDFILNSDNINKNITTIFCLKEAYIKMLGQNLSYINNINLDINNNTIKCINDSNIKILKLDTINNYIAVIIERK